MSASYLDHEETPEQRRLRLRVEQSVHNEREIEKRKAHEAQGAKEWCQKHGGGRSLPVDRSAPRDRTNNGYDPLESFGLK